MANTHSATLTSASSQGVRTTTDFTAYGTSAVSVECWVKISTTTGTRMVVNVNDTSNETFQLIAINASGYRFDVYAGGSATSSAVISRASVETGAWVHLAGVYDGANIKIYLNGVQQGSNVAKTGNLNTSNPANLGIGYRPDGPDLYHTMQIDDVRVWNDARTEAEIRSNIGTELVGNEAGLTFYWKANNAYTDETGNYSITSTGTPTFTTDVALAGTQCTDLEDGSTQYYTTPDTASLSITGNLTIEAWINPESMGTGSGMAILTKQDSGSTRSFNFVLKSNGFLEAVVNQASDGSDQSIATASTTDFDSYLGVWSHVAMVYTASTGVIQLFVNGVEESKSTNTTNATAINDSNSTIRIGAVQSTPLALFDGKIAMVRVWDTTRTGTQLIDNWCSILGSTTNLKAEWSFDGTLADTSFNGGILTKANSPIFATDYPSSCSSIAYSMVASLGTFTLTGIASGLLIGRKMVASVGAFTLTSVNAILSFGRKMVASVGTFTLTGFDIIFYYGKMLIASVGAFTLTGIDASITSTRAMVASVGTFTLTGISAIFKVGHTLVASLGTFALTGFAVALFKGYGILASLGTFTLTGVSATFSRTAIMVASVGTFTLTLRDVIFRVTGWRNPFTKNSISATNTTKNNEDWINQSKS